MSGSGLPLNPFYSGLLYLIHMVWPEPSFWLLRLPALLSGLALLALAYPLLLRVFDRPTALATLLLLACSPTLIAYSRFGWDQSQAPLASLLALYFALRRQVLGAIVAFVILLVIHPINVFLLPVLLGPALIDLVARIRAAEPKQRERLIVWLGGGLLAVLGLSLLAVKRLVPAHIVEMYTADLLPSIGKRLIDPPGWALFANRYCDLLTGVTVYRYIAGPMEPWAVWLHRGLFWAVVLPLLVLGLRRLYRQGDHTALGLLGGLGVSLVGFYLFVGPRLIAPGFERYSMWLLTPSCLALAVLGRSFFPASNAEAVGEPAVAGLCQAGPGLRPRLQPTELAACLGLLSVCAAWLIGFATCYFGVLLETGGRTHRTFRTAAVEPKQAAFEIITAALNGQPAIILAEDWWTFFPLYYLAGNHPELQVVPWKDAAKDLTPTRRFAVSFVPAVDNAMSQRAVLSPHHTINDYVGRPVLYVWDLGGSTELLPKMAEYARQARDEDVPD